MDIFDSYLKGLYDRASSGQFNRSQFNQELTNFVLKHFPADKQAEAALDLCGVMAMHFNVVLDEYEGKLPTSDA